MKVYILMDTFWNTTEGVYTAKGKNDRYKELLAEAVNNRQKKIRYFELQVERCINNTAYYTRILKNMSSDLVSERVNFVTLITQLKSEREQYEAVIENLYAMSDEKLLSEYLPRYRWEERELMGD